MILLFLVIVWKRSLVSAAPGTFSTTERLLRFSPVLNGWTLVRSRVEKQQASPRLEEHNNVHEPAEVEDGVDCEWRRWRQMKRSLARFVRKSDPPHDAEGYDKHAVH